jgi:hypothetical protein
LTSDGIQQDVTFRNYYFQLSAGLGNAVVQINYRIIAIHQDDAQSLSFAAHSFKLAADRENEEVHRK